MTEKAAGKGLKSAYEAALERLDQQGIDRPREEALSDETRGHMAEARSRAEAQLAELEIMHRQRLGRLDPTRQDQELEEYRDERRRIEARRDRKLQKLRDA